MFGHFPYPQTEGLSASNQSSIRRYEIETGVESLTVPFSMASYNSLRSNQRASSSSLSLKGYQLLFCFGGKSQHKRTRKRPRLRRMIPDVSYPQPNLFKNLARNGPFGALARTPQIPPQRNTHAPAKSTASPSRHFSPDVIRTIMAGSVRGKVHNPALRIHAGAAVPAFPDFVSASAGAAKMIALMPVHQGFGIREKRSIFSRKQRRNGSQVHKTAPALSIAPGDFLIYVHSKIRVGRSLRQEKKSESCSKRALPTVPLQKNRLGASPSVTRILDCHTGTKNDRGRASAGQPSPGLCADCSRGQGPGPEHVFRGFWKLSITRTPFFSQSLYFCLSLGTHQYSGATPIG